MRPSRLAAAMAAGVAALVLDVGAAGAADLKVRSLLDLGACTRGKALESNWEFPGVSCLDAYSGRVFADARVSPTLDVHGQVLYQENMGAYLVGAYALVTPWAGRDLHLAAGKIPWYIGSYADRAYSDRHPLIGTPLVYQYGAGIKWYDSVGSPDELLARTGRGPAAGTLPTGDGVFAGGMPILWESWWDLGVMAIGSLRPFELAAGAVNGSPGWGEAGEDQNGGKSILGRLGIAPLPAVRLGVSGSIGPYLDDAVGDSLPSGKTVRDYDQRLLMCDAELLAGHAELRAEGYRNVWQTARVGDLTVAGYYVEGKYTLPAGFYAAGRWDVLRFSRIRDSAGADWNWNADRNRAEVGGGYRVARGVVAKAVYQRTIELASGPGSRGSSYGLGATQLSISF